MIPPLTKWINDIKTKLGFSRTMTAAGADVVDAVNKHSDQIVNVEIAVAKVENGTTATQTINTGDYVYRNGTLYKYGGSTIATDATIPTFSESWIVSGGGLNNLASKIDNQLTPQRYPISWNDNITPDAYARFSVFKNVAVLCLSVTVNTTSGSWNTIGSVPSEFKPIYDVFCICYGSNGEQIICCITGGGLITVNGAHTNLKIRGTCPWIINN